MPKFLVLPVLLILGGLIWEEWQLCIPSNWKKLEFFLEKVIKKHWIGSSTIPNPFTVYSCTVYRKFEGLKKSWLQENLISYYLRQFVYHLGDIGENIDIEKPLANKWVWTFVWKWNRNYWIIKQLIVFVKINILYKNL